MRLGGLLGEEGRTTGDLQDVAERLGPAPGVALGALRHQVRLAGVEDSQVADGALAADVPLLEHARRGQVGVDGARPDSGRVGALLCLRQPLGRRRPDGAHPRRHVAARTAPDEFRGQRLGDVDVGDLGDAGQERAHPDLALGDALAGGGPLLGEPVLGPGEAVDVEQRAQEVRAVLGLGPEEPGEVALREEHDLAELVDVEPEAETQVLGALVDAGADRLPAAVGEPLDGQLGLLGGRALAALLGTLLLRAPGDQEPFAAERQLAADLGAGRRVGVVAAQPLLLAARPGDGAVQREDDGVEQRRLAGPGRPPQQEQAVAAHLVEVDRGGAGERAERGEGELVQPHRAASARSAAPRARASSSRSAAVAATPRTCWTNSPAISTSLRPRMRSW